MSIQSSINQMLSSIANQQLYKGLTKEVKETKEKTTEIPEQTKQQFNQFAQWQKQREANKQEAPVILEPTPEDIPTQPATIPTTAAIEAGATPENIPEPEDEAALVEKLKKQFGSLREAFNIADYGQTMYQDQVKMDEIYPPEYWANPEDWFGEPLSQVADTRVKMQQVSAQNTQKNVNERLAQAKERKAQNKQSTREFIERKQGGKHR